MQCFSYDSFMGHLHPKKLIFIVCIIVIFAVACDFRIGNYYSNIVKMYPLRLYIRFVIVFLQLKSDVRSTQKSMYAFSRTHVLC